MNFPGAIRISSGMEADNNPEYNNGRPILAREINSDNGRSARSMTRYSEAGALSYPRQVKAKNDLNRVQALESWSKGGNERNVLSVMNEGSNDDVMMAWRSRTIEPAGTNRSNRMNPVVKTEKECKTYFPFGGNTRIKKEKRLVSVDQLGSKVGKWKNVT